MNSLLFIFDSSCDDGCNSQSTLLSDDNLPPECEEGNVEYKLKLIDPTPARIEHLVTQMKWRLQEGRGRAIYEIGVEDRGTLKGLSQQDLNSSMKTLKLMAGKIGASVTVLNERVIEFPDSNEPRKAVEVLVQKMHDDEHNVEVEIKVTVLGSVDAGKSSLLGVLTQGELDNGKGRARLNLFRHRHEIRSGRTSSINKEMVGFDTNGSPLTYKYFQTSEEICKNSSKIVILIDSAGHPKYLKTTVSSLTAIHPDYSLLVVNALTGIDFGTNSAYLALALALELSIAIIVNKTDLCTQKENENTIVRIKQVLATSFNKKSLLISKEDEIDGHFSNPMNTDFVPIIQISCVTGVGLDLLYKFIHYLESSMNRNDKENLMKQNTVFQIDEIFHIQSVGIVVSGFLRSGLIQEDNILRIGPFEHGEFAEVSVSSVERHKVSRRNVKPGESSTLALKLSKNQTDIHLDKFIRKGMVLLNDLDQKSISVCIYFKCRVLVFSNAGKILPGRQANVFIENVRQTVMVRKVIPDENKFQERPTITIGLKFIKRPEFIVSGYRLLLQQGTTKAIGQVTKIFPLQRK